MLQVVPFGGPAPQPVRLREGAVAVPALSSLLRPTLVLAERECRSLLAAAAAQDVVRGGTLAAGPIGIQIWDRPFDGPAGKPGTAKHLGSVDWSLDTPSLGYVTISRAFVTQAGVEVGASPMSMLSRVLGLGGLPVEGARLSTPTAPRTDPFRRPAAAMMGR